MSAWQLDFKDVSTVPADPDGKQQHVVETLNTVDEGTAILVNAQVRGDFTAEPTLEAVVATVQQQGLPERVTLDRDPRFVGSPQGRVFPAPLIRLLHVLGVQVTICPPRRPDKNPCVERLNRTYKYACLRVWRPADETAAGTATAWFRQHYNDERPNQAATCGNQPPCVAFPDLPARPPLPATVDPDRSLTVLDGQRYGRKIRRNGTVKVDSVSYYVDQPRAGQYVSLRIDAAARVFAVAVREQPIKVLRIKGLIGERLPLAMYVPQIARSASAAHTGPAGRPAVAPVLKTLYPGAPGRVYDVATRGSHDVRKSYRCCPVMHLSYGCCYNPCTLMFDRPMIGGTRGVAAGVFG